MYVVFYVYLYVGWSTLYDTLSKLVQGISVAIKFYEHTFSIEILK